MVAALLAVSGAFTPATAQTLSSSRLSAHLIGSYTSGSTNIIAGKPRLLKVLALDSGFPSGMVQAMRDYKAKVPGGKVIVRVYSPKSYALADNPTASALDYWNTVLQPPLNGITALNAVAESDNSAEAAVGVGLFPVAPTAPSGLVASAGSGNIALNWTAPANAVSFKIKRATTNTGSYSVIASNVAAAPFLDTSCSALASSPVPPARWSPRPVCFPGPRRRCPRPRPTP